MTSGLTIHDWTLTQFIFLKPFEQLTEGGGGVFIVGFLVDVDEVVRYVFLHPVEVGAPLPQAVQFLRHVHVFQALGFNDDDPFGGELDQEVGVVVGDERLWKCSQIHRQYQEG